MEFKDIYNIENLRLLDKFVFENNVFVLQRTVDVVVRITVKAWIKTVTSLNILENIQDSRKKSYYFLHHMDEIIRGIQLNQINEVKSLIFQLNSYIVQYFYPSLRKELLEDERAKENGLTVMSTNDEIVKYLEKYNLKSIVHKERFGFVHSYKIEEEDNVNYYLNGKLDDRELQYAFDYKYPVLKRHKDWIYSLIVYRLVSNKLENISKAVYNKSFNEVIDENNIDSYLSFINESKIKYLVKPSLLYRELHNKAKSEDLSYNELKTSLNNFNKFDDIRIKNKLSQHFLISDLYVPKTVTKAYEKNLVKSLFSLMDDIDLYLEKNIIKGARLKYLFEKILFCCGKKYLEQVYSTYLMTCNIDNMLKIIPQNREDHLTFLTYNFREYPLLGFIIKKFSLSTFESAISIEDNKLYSERNFLSFIDNGYDCGKITSLNLKENNDLSFYKNKVDISVINFVNSRVEDKIEFLYEQFSLLKEGGYLSLFCNPDFIPNEEVANKFIARLNKEGIIVKTIVATSVGTCLENKENDSKRYVHYLFKKSNSINNYCDILELADTRYNKRIGISSLFKAMRASLLSSSMYSKIYQKVQVNPQNITPKNWIGKFYLDI